jgi:hypothetical protein
MGTWTCLLYLHYTLLTVATEPKFYFTVSGPFKLTIGCYFYTKIIVTRPGKKYQEPLSCAFHANASYVDIVFLKAQAKFQRAQPRLCLRKDEIPNSNEIAVFFKDPDSGKCQIAQNHQLLTEIFLLRCLMYLIP